LTKIDWEALSPRAAAILEVIGVPLALELSLAEIARSLNCSPEQVSRWRGELRAELEAQLGSQPDS
jgi:transposase-like protein